jgi:hypothetical protein
MDVRGLAFLLSAGLFFSGQPARVQVPTLHPERIAGPWETVSAAGIDGVFFQFVTSSSGPSASPQIDWQTIDIRVYHRQERKETQGWFATIYKAAPGSSDANDGGATTQFDGQRLRINFTDTTDLKPFDLDLTFSPNEQVWTGTWSRSGQASHVVLQRPTLSAGATPSGFVGDWDAELDSPADTPGSLHIRQSSDGILTAWFDRIMSGTESRTNTVHSDRRDGEFLRVDSIPGTGLLLETTNPMGPAYHYRGTLSDDRQVITGNWDSGSGGKLNAPAKFRRVL